MSFFFSLLYCFILNMLYNCPLCHVGTVVTAGFGHFFYVSSVSIKLKSKFCLKADLKQTCSNLFLVEMVFMSSARFILIIFVLLCGFFFFLNLYGSQEVDNK